MSQQRLTLTATSDTARRRALASSALASSIHVVCGRLELEIRTLSGELVASAWLSLVAPSREAADTPEPDSMGQPIYPC